MQIRAAVLYEANSPLSIETVDLDPPGHNEVLVKMVATGICHSDLHIIKGHDPSPFPVVLGHEGGGIIEETGPGVTDLRPGDHVVLPAMFTCGKCRYCVEGEPALCSEALPAHLMGSLPGGGKRLHKNGLPLNVFYSQGSFAEYVVVHERTAVKVRDDAPLDVVCLLSCAISTGVGCIVNRARIRTGENVVTYGCGGVGLSVIMGAKLSGAGKIIAVDLIDWKLDLARELGADFTVNASKEDPQQRILEITGGGADYSIESIGSIPAIQQAFASIHSGGTCVLVGAPPMTELLELAPFEFLLGKTLTGTLLGNARSRIDIPRYVDLYMDSKLPIEKLVSGYCRLEDINGAFLDLEEGRVIREIVRF